jgi:transposase-like protein
MTEQSLTRRVALEARNIQIRKGYASGRAVASLSEEFELSKRHIKVYIIEFNREPMKRRLSPEGKQILIQMWEAGASLDAIAKATGLDISNVKRWRRRYGLAARHTGNPFGKAGRPPHVPHPDSY